MFYIIKVHNEDEWSDIFMSIGRDIPTPHQQPFPYYLGITKNEDNSIAIYSAGTLRAFGMDMTFVLYNYYIANKEAILFELLL